MKVSSLLLVCVLTISIYPQQNSIFEKQKNNYRNDSRESYKVKTQLKRTNNQVLKPLQLLNTSGQIDTLSYNDGTFGESISVTGQDWLLQWYEAPVDLRIMKLGFYCTANPDDLPAEVKIVKVNWSAEQLITAGIERWGYYKAASNGYNNITAFLDNPDRTGGWTSIQPGVAEPFGNDIWSDGGVGFSFIPDETLQDYQWIGLDLYQPTVLTGEIFCVALKNPYPIMDEGTISFQAGVIGVPGWKFYANGRSDPGVDYGWWTQEFTPDFPVIVDLTGDLPPSINWYTIIPSGLDTGPFIIEANITDTNPGDTTNAGVAGASIFYSIDSGRVWIEIPMPGSEPDYTGVIPPQSPGTTVYYIISASDINNNFAQTPTTTFHIFNPSGATNLVIFNGLNSIDGFPQDYYWGADIQSGNDAFAHDRWAYGELPLDVANIYTNIIEICNSGPINYNDTVISPWLEADGSHNYFLTGQEWLGARWSFVDQDFAAGSFEYDILGINHSYNDVSYDGASSHLIPSLVMPAAGTMFGNPLLDLFNSLNPPADSMMYNPDFEVGMDNWIDAFDVEVDVEVDMYVETRGIEGLPNVQILPTMARRTLPAGNKIMFVAYDPLSLNTANDGSFPYYFWIGFDEANSPYQVLDWFGIVIIDDVGESNGEIPAEFSLSQNYPNPFNPSTIISWQSPVGSWQTLKIYDVLGNEVVTLVDEYKPAGEYEVEFNPASDIQNQASGIYFYQLKAGSFIQTKKMVFLK